MNFIEIFNAISSTQKVDKENYIPVEVLETDLKDTGLDSLDTTLVYVIIGELYGIPSSKDKQYPVTNIKDLFEFVEANKTKDPMDRFKSVAEAMKEVL